MPNPRKLKATVTRIEDHGDGVYGVTMEVMDRPPLFRAGQFLHLALDAYDQNGGFWPESRVFSIASLPGDSNIEIVYSVKGRYTSRMEQNLRVGAPLWLKMPFGDFIIERHLEPDQSAVLIAGGTGVSPFVPFARKRLAENGDGARAIRLHYGVRTSRHLLWPELWDECVSSGAVDARLYLENEVPPLVPSSHAPRIAGRLDIGSIIEDSVDLRDPAFFISGPPAMIQSFKQRLAIEGIAESRVIFDEWE